MNILDHSNNNSPGLSDGSMLPLSNDQDKLYSILNVLKGHEEFTLNPGGVIISSNLEAVNITGYEEWEVIGKHFSILYTEEDILKKQPAIDLESSAATRKFVVNSWKLKRRQVKFWARIKIIPLFDSLDTLRGYKVVLRDAAHKVLTDLNVQKIKNEYLNFYHNSTFGLFRFRRHDGHLRMANKKALEILGITALYNFSFRDAFHNDDDFVRFNELIDVQENINYFEFQLKTPPGSPKRWASIDCKWYESSELIEGILIDVTSKKSGELTLQKLHNDLDTFIYHASHDLRSPLTSVMGLLNLMELQKMTDVSEFLPMMRDRINHLDALLRDLSTIAFNNNSEVNYERVFIKEEINFITRGMGEVSQVRFYLSITDNAVFTSDVLRFRTIVKNLISNSVKYYNQMEKDPFVKITVTSGGDKVELVVEDNGIGIEKAEMEKIYNMFHRGHSSKSGSGLGLYTVRSMVDQLGGSINLTSAIGQGTKVTIELPNK